MTIAEQMLAFHKLMAAATYLDEDRHQRITKLASSELRENYETIEFLRSFLPDALDAVFAADRAERWKLPPDAIEYLDSQKLTTPRRSNEG